MDEDTRYRTSTQYRLWSFSQASLSKLRQDTNRVAAEKVRDAIRRVRAAKRSTSNSDGTYTDVETGGSEAESGSGGKTNTSVRLGVENMTIREEDIDVSDVDCLTVEDELKLLGFYCRQLLQLGDHLQVPTDVKV